MAGLRRNLIRLLAAALAVASSVEPIHGQGRGGATYPAVFGGAAQGRPDSQSLSASGTIEQAYDDNVLLDAIGGIPLYQLSGFYTGLNGDVDYSAHTDHLQAQMTGGTNARYYSTIGRAEVVSYMAGAALTAKVGHGLQLSANQSLAYSPSYLFGLFATVLPPGAASFLTPAPNYAVNNNLRSYALDSKVQATQSFGRRFDAYVGADLDSTDFTVNVPGVYGLKSHDANGGVTYHLSRRMSARMTYVQRQVRLSASGRTDQRDVSAGFEYDRPLSRTRKATFAFTVGQSALSGPLFGVAAGTFRQYGVTGSGSVGYQFGRTWQLLGAYNRQVTSLQGLSTPFLTNGATLGVSGFLDRRTDVSMTAAYTGGSAVLTAAPALLATYTADVRLRHAFARNWAPYVEYLYYVYRFDRNVTLPVGVPPNLSRNSVRVGMAMWVPFWRRK